MELLPTTGNSLDNINYNQQNYVIAIPSYNRSDSIQTKTLAVLQQNNIEPSIIYIFVANKEQYDIYLQAIPKHLYGTLVIGLLGLKINAIILMIIIQRELILLKWMMILVVLFN